MNAPNRRSSSRLRRPTFAVVAEGPRLNLVAADAPVSAFYNCVGEPLKEQRSAAFRNVRKREEFFP